MALTPEAKRKLVAQQKRIEQIIVDDTFAKTEVHIEPYTPFILTDNIGRRSLSYLLGKRIDTDAWKPVFVDDEGKLILTDNLSHLGYIGLGGRVQADFILFDAVSVPATSLATHTGIDVSAYTGMTVLMDSTGSVTVRPQFSDNNTDWYDWCDSAGTAISWTCDSVKKAIGVDDHCHYLRFVVTNTSATAKTVNLRLSAVV